MTLTFVDAGVLIAAARGDAEEHARAIEVLDDPDRSFASSDFVRLEALPKAVYNKQKDEAAFYETFFENVSCWAEPDVNLTRLACNEAKRAGLAAMDALHVAAASRVGAQELVTTEKPGKPIHRATLVKTTTISR